MLTLFYYIYLAIFLGIEYNYMMYAKRSWQLLSGASPDRKKAQHVAQPLKGCSVSGLVHVWPSGLQEHGM